MRKRFTRPAGAERWGSGQSASLRTDGAAPGSSERAAARRQRRGKLLAAPAAPLAARSLPIRGLLYALIIAAMFESLVLVAPGANPNWLFGETGPIESLQLLLLLASAMLLEAASVRGKLRLELLHVLALLLLAAASRELDWYLDELFDGAWQVAVFTIAVYGSAIAWRARYSLAAQARRIVPAPAVGVLFAGFTTVMVFSRLVGQQLFWRAVLREDYVRLAGRVAEESSELFGYALLFFGCIELVLAVRSGGRIAVTPFRRPLGGVVGAPGAAHRSSRGAGAPGLAGAPPDVGWSAGREQTVPQRSLQGGIISQASTASRKPVFAPRRRTAPMEGE